MIRQRLVSIGWPAWTLTASVLLASILSLILRSIPAVDPQYLTYLIQPVMFSAIALGTRFLLKGRVDRIRRRFELATIVGSVLVIWFVLYFISGLLLTYMRNTLSGDVVAIIYNLLAFGLIAFSMEYIRHGVIMLAGRRNAVWFGLLVALIFALPAVNLFGLMTVTSLEDFIHLFVSDFVPGLTMSLVLTYLAVTSGLPSQLVLRLGMVAIMILPPIIPRYDWYLLGISWLLLALMVYITIDNQHRRREVVPRRRHIISRISDWTMTTALLGLVLFSSGLLHYQPMTIMSNSMQPTYSRGSMVVVEHGVPPVDIREGDIIQYRKDNISITHRVIEINEDSAGSGRRVFITQGDNNSTIDKPVSEADLLGVVRASIPWVGYPTVWIRELAR